MMNKKAERDQEGRKRRRRDEKSIMMPNLPGDIVDDILLMLPAKSICRFKCVCKQWYELFKNPDFVKIRLKNSIESENLNCFSINCKSFYMHITKSLFMSVFENDHCASVKMDSPLKFDTNITNIEILDSCNGLILMRCHYSHRLDSPHWVWNPYTEERKEILIPKVDVNLSLSFVFDYNCGPDDYAIVVATCYDTGLVGCSIQVYTVKSKLWKSLANIVPYKIRRTYGHPKGILVHGVVYWIAVQLQSQKTCIVSFDIHGEKFNEVAVTPEVDSFLNDTNSDMQTLSVLGGCLCIIRPYGTSMFDFNIEIWETKDINVAATWTKLFTVKPPLEAPNYISHVKLLWEFKNGEVLFVTNELKYEMFGTLYKPCSTGKYDWYCRFVLYDPVRQICKVTRIQDTPLYKFNIEAYFERSTVLNSIG